MDFSNKLPDTMIVMVYNNSREPTKITVSCLIVPNRAIPSRLLAVHHSTSQHDDKWTVSDYITGRRVAGGKTKKQAYENAIDRILRTIDKIGFKQVINELEKYESLNK